jgi:hypothetical protein
MSSSAQIVTARLGNPMPDAVLKRIRVAQEHAINDVLTHAPQRLGRLLPYLSQDTMDDLFRALAHQAQGSVL